MCWVPWGGGGGGVVHVCIGLLSHPRSRVFQGFICSTDLRGKGGKYSGHGVTLPGVLGWEFRPPAPIFLFWIMAQVLMQ
jgi:hypothetical protein